jgi:hypothetical protein
MTRKITVTPRTTIRKPPSNRPPLHPPPEYGADEIKRLLWLIYQELREVNANLQKQLDNDSYL